MLKAGEEIELLANWSIEIYLYVSGVSRNMVGASFLMMFGMIQAVLGASNFKGLGLAKTSWGNRMSVQSLKEEIKSVDWQSFNGPPSYNADAVPPALIHSWSLMIQVKQKKWVIS